jgi:hypothetical protein
MTRYLPYLFAGMLFGFTMVKAEAASWYRIQEMFHFQSFHMFGILFSAIATAFVSIQLIKRMKAKKAIDGQEIEIPGKEPGRINYLAGGLIFGLGWGVMGLCPGPVFAMVGTGSGGALVVLLGALHGTWLYGAFKSRLPH